MILKKLLRNVILKKLLRKKKKKVFVRPKYRDLVARTKPHIAYVVPPCIFLNGALHTEAITCRHRFILSFDVNDESFREIMLPPNHLDGVLVNLDQLAMFKGSLAVIVFVHGHRGIFCHIWVMEEYGVAESWT